ncbi:MAG: hypothetical protein ACR2RV_17940 [Verrucomicrobiales bacterium]
MSRSQPDPAYYPRRAGHFSWLWYRWFRLKQVRLWKRVVSAEYLGDTEQLLSLLLPGYVFIALGYRRFGVSILIGFFVAALVSLAAIGLPLATLCYCFMLSAQSMSIQRLLVVRARGARGSVQRICLALVLVIGLGALVYAPLYQFVRSYIVTPLHTRDGIILVNPRSGADRVQKGDGIAYGIDAESGDGYHVREGVLYGSVLASEGDRIEFASDHYEINGTSHVSKRWMPSEGELTVEPGFWFVWAHLMVQNDPGNDIDVPALILSRTAIVPRERFIGILYRNWFGRNQSHLHQDTRSSP